MMMMIKTLILSPLLLLQIFKTTPDGAPPSTFQTRTPTASIPNSASSSISSSSSASSSKASPRHGKTATANSTAKDGVGGGVSREHSPRRPGESLRNRWNIMLRRVDTGNRANNNATHLHNGNTAGSTQTLPNRLPYRTTGNSMFYTKPIDSPTPISPNKKSPPPVSPRPRTPQPTPTRAVDPTPRSVTPSPRNVATQFSFNMDDGHSFSMDHSHSSIPIYSQVAKTPRSMNGMQDASSQGVSPRSPMQQYLADPRPREEQSLMMETGRVAALRRRFLLAPADKPGLRSVAVDIPRPTSSVASLALFFQQNHNHGGNPPNGTTNPGVANHGGRVAGGSHGGRGGGGGGGGGSSGSGCVAPYVSGGVVLRKPRRRQVPSWMLYKNPGTSLSHRPGPPQRANSLLFISKLSRLP